MVQSTNGLNAPVAQPGPEQGFPKPKVAGSNPAGGTISKVAVIEQIMTALLNNPIMKDFKPFGAEIMPEGFITVTGKLPLISYYVFDIVFVMPD